MVDYLCKGTIIWFLTFLVTGIPIHIQQLLQVMLHLLLPMPRIDALSHCLVMYNQIYDVYSLAHHDSWTFSHCFWLFLQVYNSWFYDTPSTSYMESTGAPPSTGVENEHHCSRAARLGSSSIPAATTATISNPGSRLTCSPYHINKTPLTTVIRNWSTFAIWSWSHPAVCTITAPLSLATKWASTAATTACCWEPRY